ncbi:MAG: neutral/alkaline non-lysosomal ceramidase N-terminal domain-containing protein [Halobacteriota archaeon]
MLYAGAYSTDINPDTPQFLFGYPHVERYHTGIHDDLTTAALYVNNGSEQILFIANDIIFVSKEMTNRVREQITLKTGIAGSSIMITATHTHSGPKTVNYASNTADSVVPNADQSYIDLLITKMTEAGVQAKKRSEPAIIGLSHADSTGIGTNRRDPGGPSNHDVPTLLVRDAADTHYIACMMIVSMHPTVLHEDSTLISADFHGAAKAYLKSHVFGSECVLLTHSGPCGNQSPRHVTTENTFAEVERLGTILGQAVEKVASQVAFRNMASINTHQVFLEKLPKRTFPPLQQAEKKLSLLRETIQSMRSNHEPANKIRTIECDIFGAEEMVTLSRMQESGELEDYYAASLPAEIHMITLGTWNFVGWSGEVFVEYALEVKQHCPNTFVISMANGETQGYITTKEAADEGGYEASNALFSYETGQLFVEKTLEMCKV